MEGAAPSTWSQGLSRKATPALIVAIVLAAMAVRVVGLTERAVWLDEVLSLEVSAHPVAEIARGEVFDNHTPPLYYLLLHGWFRIVPENAFTLRLPSVLADLACLLVLTAGVARAFGRRTGLWVGAAYAIAPFSVRIAQEGRMYSLLALLVVGCFAWAIEIDRHRATTWPYVGLALTAAAALYTHYYSILSLVVMHIVMVWRLRGDWTARRRWWGAMAGAGIAYLPWLPMVGHLVASGGQAFRPFGVAVLPYAGLRFAVGYSVLPMNVVDKMNLGGAMLQHLLVIVVIGSAVAAVVLLGACDAVTRRSTEDLGASQPDRSIPAGRLVLALAAAPPVLAVAVTAVVPSLDDRYLVICFPFALTLAVLGVSTRHARRWLPFKAIAVIAFLVGAVAQVADPDAGVTPWRAAMAEIELRAPSGGEVLVRPGFYDRVLRYGLDPDSWHIVDDPDLLDPSRPAWLVEVVFLTREQPLDTSEWALRDPRVLTAGNGVRVALLIPRRVRREF